VSDTPQSPFADETDPPGMAPAPPSGADGGGDAPDAATEADRVGEADTGDSGIDMAKVEEVIEIMRPAIQADGGDIELIGVDDSGVVTVELQGACVSCPASTVTMKAGIERIMKDRVEGVTAVVQPDEDDLEMGTAVSL
jgi:Fe-S cluster biogenesis protein NfuA